MSKQLELFPRPKRQRTAARKRAERVATFSKGVAVAYRPIMYRDKEQGWQRCI